MVTIIILLYWRNRGYSTIFKVIFNSFSLYVRKEITEMSWKRFINRIKYLNFKFQITPTSKESIFTIILKHRSYSVWLQSYRTNKNRHYSKTISFHCSESVGWYWFGVSFLVPIRTQFIRLVESTFKDFTQKKRWRKIYGEPIRSKCLGNRPRNVTRQSPDFQQTIPR